MGRKSHHKTRAHADRKDKPVMRIPARQVLDTLLADAKIERQSQAEILQELIKKHHGDIPVPVLWSMRAQRLQQPARVL